MSTFRHDSTWEDIFTRARLYARVKKRKTVTEEKQQNNGKQPKQAADYKEANKDIFSWSNNEIQLLLMAVLDF